MKKFGFTLAEVLITLGIIGVVAALTAPQLITSSKNEATGAKVSVTVSALENAFQNAMIDQNQEDLANTTIWSNLGYLGKYMNVASIDAPASTIYTKSGIKVVLDKTPGQLKTDAQSYGSGSALQKRIAGVYIYTEPNKEDVPGKNAFYFILDKKGILFPYGGKDANIYNSNNRLWSQACADVGTNHYACTGRLVENGYKMDY